MLFAGTSSDDFDVDVYVTSVAMAEKTGARAMDQMHKLERRCTGPMQRTISALGPASFCELLAC